MYVFRELTDLSYPQIAQEFGGRDHTTVIHAVEKISALMKERQAIYDEVQSLDPDDQGRLMGRDAESRPWTTRWTSPVDDRVDDPVDDGRVVHRHAWNYAACRWGQLGTTRWTAEPSS